MANVPIIGRKAVISDGGNNYYFGEAAPGQMVATMAFMLVANGLTGGSITVNAVTKGDAVKDAATPLATVYKKLFLNGLVADGSLASAAITGTSLILIPASGLDIVLTIASISAGNWTIYSQPVEGFAA